MDSSPESLVWYCYQEQFAQPSAGSGYEMDAITAVVLGGVSLNGGEGKLHMVVIGMLIMGVLTTGMIMCGINDYVQQFVKKVLY